MTHLVPKPRRKGNRLAAWQRMRIEAGFTIIELLMVISVMGLVMILAVPNFNFVPGTEASQKINALLGDIRSAYDMAVLTRKNYRLVFEFKSGEYWLESTDREDILLGEVRLDRDPTPEEIKEKAAVFDEEFEQYLQLAGKEVEDSENEKVISQTSPLLAAKSRLKPAEWKAVEDAEWKRRSLGPSFVIRSLQAEHHVRLQTLEELGDQAYAHIYFFPHGYMERAVIHLAPADLEDRNRLDELTYTIVTLPYEGMAVAETGFKEVNVLDEEAKR